MGSISHNSMRYRLTLPEGVNFDLQGGRQLFTENILTVTREKIPDNTPPPACSDLGDTLFASPYIQSDHQEIVILTNQIAGNEHDPVKKVEKISTWVYENLNKRPVLGLPDALTTLHSRQGDCNEHAVLFAALARAARIPTRIATGVTLHQNAFYYHAWNEVCLGSNWFSIDSTINQFPADLTHLRFILGEMQEQVRIGALLGKLAIEPLPEP